MSVSYYVVGTMDPNEEFMEMKKIWELCEKNKIPIPDNVEDYFNGRNPINHSGLEVDITNAVSKHVADTSMDYSVDLQLIPKNVRFIKFIVSC